MILQLNKVKPCSPRVVLDWVTYYELPRVVITFFFFFFPFLFQGDIKGLQNCHPCVMSFLLFINFLFLISQWPYLHRINKQWDTFEFSSILSTVDLSKHLITAWIIRKFIQLVNFVTFSVFFFFFGNMVNAASWAGTVENELFYNYR